MIKPIKKFIQILKSPKNQKYKPDLYKKKTWRDIDKEKTVGGVRRTTIFFIIQFIAFLMMIVGFLLFVFMWYLKNK